MQLMCLKVMSTFRVAVFATLEEVLRLEMLPVAGQMDVLKADKVSLSCLCRIRGKLDRERLLAA